MSIYEQKPIKIIFIILTTYAWLIVCKVLQKDIICMHYSYYFLNRWNIMQLPSTHYFKPNHTKIKYLLTIPFTQTVISTMIATKQLLKNPPALCIYNFRSSICFSVCDIHSTCIIYKCISIKIKLSWREFVYQRYMTQQNSRSTFVLLLQRQIFILRITTCTPLENVNKNSTCMI